MSDWPEFETIQSLTDPQVIQLHELYRSEWWSGGRRLEDVRRLIENSRFIFGICDSRSKRLVAFARVLTDGIFKALIFDVIVAQDFRDLGLGGRLLDSVLAHPGLQGVKQFELYCLPELVPYYERWGFSTEVGGVVLMRKENGE
jgi:hypothetical protein